MRLLLFFFFLGFTQISLGQNHHHEPQKINKKDSLIYEFALEMEDAFYGEDTTFFEEKFNEELFADYFLVKSEGNSDLEMYNMGFKEGMGAVLTNFYENIHQEINAGGSYNLVNYSEDEVGNYYIRFRMFGEEGLNYHEFYIPNQGDDTIEITDVFIIMTGEFMSETITPIYLSGVKEMVGDLDELEGVDGYDLNSVFKLRDIKQLYDEGKEDEARAELKKLPEAIQDRKIVLLYKLLLFDETDEEYAAILQQLEETSNLKATQSLISIDRYFVNQEFDKALEAVAILKDYTEDDFLDFYTANVYLEKGDMEKAEENYKSVIANYPYTSEGYEGLLTLYTSTEQYDLAVEQLDLLIEYMELDKSIVTEYTEEFYPEFVKTKAYKDWKAE